MYPSSPLRHPPAVSPHFPIGSLRPLRLDTLHTLFVNACATGQLPQRSPATLQNYRTTFALFIKSTPAQVATDLTETLVRGFFRHGQTKLGWSPSTAASYRKNLSPFFAWCVAAGTIPENPLLRLPKPVVLRAHPDFYKEAEIERLLAVIDSESKSEFERLRNRAILGTFFLAGLRRGELLALRLSDVDLDIKVIRVRAETAKNREPRAVAIVWKLHELLRAYLAARTSRGAQTSKLWVSSTHHAGFTLSGLHHLVKRLSKQVGFRVKPHKMRHTFATQTYQGSRDIASIQQALGHRDLKTTMIYTHVIPAMTAPTLEQNPVGFLF